MKKLLIATGCLLLLNAAIAQKVKRPGFDYKGKPFETFAPNNYRAPRYSAEKADSSANPSRVLVSFVVNTSGGVDSVTFYETGSSSVELENSVRELLGRSSGYWKPVKRNGHPVASAPLYFGISVLRNVNWSIWDDIQMPGTEKAFFRDYAYSALPNWQPGSFVYEPMYVVTSPGISCGFNPTAYVPQTQNTKPARPLRDTLSMPVPRISGTNIPRAVPL